MSRSIFYSAVLVGVLCACAHAPEAPESLFVSLQSQPPPASPAPPAVAPPPELPVVAVSPGVSAVDLLRGLHRLATGRASAEKDLLAWSRRSIAFDVAYMHVSVEAVRTMAADGRDDPKTLDGLLQRALGELTKPVTPHLRQVLAEYLMILALGESRRPWHDQKEVQRGIAEFQQLQCDTREVSPAEQEWATRAIAIRPLPDSVALPIQADVQRIRLLASDVSRVDAIDCGDGRTLFVATVGRGKDARLVPIRP